MPVTMTKWRRATAEEITELELLQRQGKLGDLDGVRVEEREDGEVLFHVMVERREVEFKPF